jgi:hypothetical protein
MLCPGLEACWAVARRGLKRDFVAVVVQRGGSESAEADGGSQRDLGRGTAGSNPDTPQPCEPPT